MRPATELYEKIKGQKPLSTSNATLDKLLHGGFMSDTIYFLHGPTAMMSTTLMNVAVNFFLPPIDGGKGSPRGKVAYVDGLNRFNPYYISKFAVSNRLGANYVLKNIVVSRVFTWSQMGEVLQEKIHNLEEIGLILVAGLTNMLNEHIDANHNARPFQDLKKMFGGLNKSIEKSQPTVVMTGLRHPKSRFKPLGGTQLAHFCQIIVGIYEYRRYIDFKLEQHPFLPYRAERYWKNVPMQDTRKRRKTIQQKLHNTNLDAFM